MAKLIYLSPSNHGKNQNKCLRPDCYEDKHTRPIAEVCAKYLKNSGFDVIIGQTSQNMAKRCQEANSKGASLYVPIHTNASATESARYLLFMFYQDNAAYRAIYNAVAPFLEAIYPGGIKAQFSKRANLYEINRPSAKTIYCELGFHTNQTDVDSFIHDSESVGKALAQGICKYFGVPFTQGGESVSPQPDPAPSVTAGKAVKLVSTPLYSSSTGKVPATHVNGTYYLWDDKVIKGRIRITNIKSRVGVAGQVTGWIDKKYI